MHDKFFLNKRNHKRTIMIVSIPNAGHIKILARMASEVLQTNADLTIHFLLTSWKGHLINEQYIEALKQACGGNPVIIFESANTANHTGDTFGRAKELTPQVIDACQQADLIMYDFMTPEGYIAGKKLSIPTICLEPSYVGQLDTSSKEYHKQLAEVEPYLSEIETELGLELKPQLRLVSGVLSFHAPQNILFLWEKLTLVGDYKNNSDELKSCFYFMRPNTKNMPALDSEFSYIEPSDKKIIYFSLGTIATGIVWDESNQLADNLLQSFITCIYISLIAIATQRNDLIFIFSTGRDIVDIIGSTWLPPNVHWYKTLDQIALLPHVDLFITHCGANSVNEAIDSETPMLGIPLMFDQHQCAYALHQLELGHSFLLSKDHVFFRPPFDSNDTDKTQKALEDRIDKLLAHDFSAAFAAAKLGNTLDFQLLTTLIDSAIHEHEKRPIPGITFK